MPNIVQKDFYGFVVDSAGNVIGAVNRYGVVAPIGSLPPDVFASQLAAPSSTAALSAQLAGLGVSAAVRSTARVAVASVGDSISRNNYTNLASGGNIGQVRGWTGFGAWVAMAAGLTGGACWADVYACEGYSGKRTDEILALLQPAGTTETWGPASTIPVGIASRTPQIVVDMSGTNDLTYYENAADAYGIAKTVAGRLAIWNYIRSVGAQPVALSLLPRTAPAAFANRVPAYNAAIKAAAAAANVPFVDVYTGCANADGTWKPGFIYHQGVNDITGLHPSWLATSTVIAPALAATLKSIIYQGRSIPRIAPGNGPLYSTAFVNANGDYFKNWGDGALPNTTGWVSRYDPQGDSSFGLITPTIDAAGGGTIQFIKPVQSGSTYADWRSPAVTVAAGQRFLAFADVKFKSADGLGGLSFLVTDSTYQPMASFAVATGESPVGFDGPVGRIALDYIVPTGVTGVYITAVINRSSGGTSGSDAIQIANVGQIRLA